MKKDKQIKVDEKPKRGRPKKKSNEEEAEEIKYLANKAELKQHLSNSNKINNEIKNNTYKEGNMMKGSSELKKKNNKYYIETEININNDMNDKIKRAFVKSIIEELNKKIDGYDFFYQKKN